MSFILIQFKTHSDGYLKEKEIIKCNPVTADYVDLNSAGRPFLVLYMQLGKSKSNEDNRAYFGGDLQLDSAIQNLIDYHQIKKLINPNSFKMTRELGVYLKNNQMVVATRGITTESFAFLSSEECRALESLALAKSSLEKYF